MLAGPVDEARVGVRAPSLGMTFELLPRPSIGLARGLLSQLMVEVPGVMAGTVWLEESRKWVVWLCDVLVCR